MNAIIVSLKKINHKMFWSLLCLNILPTLYTTLRIFFLGQLPNEWAYSIAGQLNWLNLIYEIFTEAIILPLYFFIGKVCDNKEELNNQVKSGLLFTLLIFVALSFFIIVFVHPLLNFMAVNQELIAASASYIRIESIANIFSILGNFTLVVLVSLNQKKWIYILTFIKVSLIMISDTFLLSNLPFSLNLGVNGIGYSNIIVNILLLAYTVYILSKEGIQVFSAKKLSFSWLKELFKIGGLSGLESLIRNLAYMIMIVRMINVVNEQGVYWVANSFIWGWLLIPVLQLAELVKRDCGMEKERAIEEKTLGYFTLTGLIVLIWFITIPLWKPFMSIILHYSNVDTLFNLILLLLGFYILFAFQNICDATFYGMGKTNYMIFQTIVTNCIYYGGAYILYLQNMWNPSLTGIALLFGGGIAFDAVVTFIAYWYYLKKNKITLVTLTNN